MKKTIFLLAALLSACVSSVFISCRYDLIPESTVNTGAQKNPADYENIILPPAEVTATQGGYRSITLSWTPVVNAVRYQIFYAKTPFDSFEKLVETSDAATTYDVDVPSGSTYYFYVKAVNYYETVSFESVKTFGSSLAIPIITNLDAADDAQSVTVQWWMDNCSEETYENKVKFTVKVLDADKKEIPGAALEKEGTCRSATVTGLFPSTNYYFTVQADIIDAEQKGEVSDITNKETTHSIIPPAVSDFKVTQGIDSEGITLSWNLPEGADYYDAFTNTYSIHPVLFAVERNEMGKDDSAFKNIAFIGIKNESAGKDQYQHPFPIDLSFDCSTETSSSSELTVNTATASGNIDANNTYPQYMPGSTLLFTDKNTERGKQYTYRITSITDDTTKVFKADSSVSSPEDGWLISPAKFKASAEYIKNEESTAFTFVNINFDFDFVPFTTPYNYILTQKITPFKKTPEDTPEPGEEKVIFISESVAAIAEKQISFNVEAMAAEGDDWKGSYKFKLYITGKDITSVPAADEFFEAIESSGTIAVTDDVNNMPKITNFDIKDGYSDKFILSWDYNEAYSYSITWIPVVNGTPLAEEKLDVSAEDLILSEDGTTATFEHAAVSGDARTYCLTAENGLPVSKFYTDSNDVNILCKTLGTAVPVMDKPDYTKITITWPDVQMAENYTLSAKYQNNENETYDNEAAALGELLTEENYTLTKDSETGAITCEITNIAGYDNPKISGLPIDFTITASNSLDSTVKTEEVCNLGPALTFPATDDNTKADSISFSWNKVNGADKYLVYRVLYSDKSETEIWATDKYIVSEANGVLSIETDQDIGDRAAIRLNGSKFTLTDNQKDAVEIYGYQLNQEKIQWGLPFGYVVLPLKADGSKNTFEFDSENPLATKETATVNFGQLEDKRTSTYGYGMNIRAGKSVSASEISISWEAPNNKSLIPTVYRKKFIKGENPDYGEEWENIIPEGGELSAGATTYSDKLSKRDISSAFVYCVQYKAPSRSDIVSSYRNELLSKMDTDYSPAEPKNKGYLLTLEEFSAKYGGTGTTETSPSYYQENITWNTQWDYEERALGPDSFTFGIKNRNLSSTMNWKPIADFIVEEKILNGKTTKVQTLVENENYTSEKDEDFVDTTIIRETGSVSLKPTGLSSGSEKSTEGLLKVLRDAKHYYSVNLTRGEITVRQGDDGSIYAYRQISPEELCKCVGLIIADSLYACGIPNRKTYQNAGHTGEFKIACSTGTTDANRVQWQCSAYTTKFLKGCSADNMGTLISFLTLNSSTSSFENKGIYDETLYLLPELSIEVTCNPDIKLSSYTGNITMSAGSDRIYIPWSVPIAYRVDYNLNMNVNDKACISISNDEDQMYQYFPYDLGNRHITPDSSINTNLKTYQSPWWN